MGETTLRQALSEYSRYHLAARNYYARTRVEYTHDLEEGVEFLDKAGVSRIGEISLTRLECHLANLDETGLSGAARKRKSVVIRAFWSYLHKVGYLPTYLSRGLIVPFDAASTPRVLTQTEYQPLLTACSANTRDVSFRPIMALPQFP